jgi:hypothetical protein
MLSYHLNFYKSASKQHLDLEASCYQWLITYEKKLLKTIFMFSTNKRVLTADFSNPSQANRMNIEVKNWTTTGEAL